MKPTKEETQFFKFIREKYFKKEEFKIEIKKWYENEHEILTKDYILENASNIIFRLVEHSTQIWNDAVLQAEKNWVELYLTEDELTQKKFPTIYKQFKNLEKIQIKEKEINQLTINVFNELSELFSKMVFSNKQSGKSNAGNLFEYHIATLLDVCGYRYEPQVSITKGEVLDFILPSLEFAEKNPEHSISAECQNTLKDRVRLTQGKLQASKLKKYLITPSGLNAATKSDHGDFSLEKINQLKESKITLVLYDEIKTKKFPKKSNVISFENFFNNVYPEAEKKW